MSKKNNCINLLLMVLSIVMTLAFIELALRLTGYVGDVDRQRMTFDQQMGDVEKDSWVFDIRNISNGDVRINESMVPLEKSPGTTRILFLGDSSTFGTGVEYNQSFPFKFERYFNALSPDEKIEVINAGVYGMTTIAEYLLLRDDLLALNPDIVILGLFMANDINLNLLHNARRVRLERNSRAFIFLQSIKENSALAHYIFLKLLAIEQKHRSLNSTLIDANDFLPVEFSLRDENGLNFASYFEGEIATYFKKYSSTANFAFEVLESVLFDFKDLSKEHGFIFKIVLIPTASSIAGRLEMPAFPEAVKLIKQSQGHHKIDLKSLDFTKPTKKVLSICTKLELSCIDPTSEMREEGLDVMLPGDDHLSVKGHDIVAKKLVHTVNLSEITD